VLLFRCDCRLLSAQMGLVVGRGLQLHVVVIPMHFREGGQLIICKVAYFVCCLLEINS